MKPRLILRRVLTKPVAKPVRKVRAPRNAREFRERGCHKCGAKNEFTYEDDSVNAKSTAMCDNCGASMWSVKWKV